MVSFQEFKNMDLRVARILEVQDHPNADKLYVLKVETGEEPRTLVAGIRAHYSKEELAGKLIVVITNLEPATIRGVKSEGMLLAAQDSGRIVILTPEKEVAAGSKIS